MTSSERQLLTMDASEIKSNIGFVLTVIRDNTVDDDNYIILDALVKKLASSEKK